MSADLYRDSMLRLASRADSAEPLADADASVTLDNPLCGDRVTVDVHCDGQGRIDGIGHRVRGCVLCRAATAVLGEHACGADAAEFAAVHARLRESLRAGALPAGEAGPWSDLAVFAPVGPYRSRHDCVLLPFEAVLEALEQAGRGAGE